MTDTAGKLAPMPLDMLVQRQNALNAHYRSSAQRSVAIPRFVGPRVENAA
ncbi:MAG: hypothetical protein JWP89_6732 [Schlesneria sp.]|nr:hypothetical protein [Schlesneria sp.]